jgi:hypothetical protein
MSPRPKATPTCSTSERWLTEGTGRRFHNSPTCRVREPHSVRHMLFPLPDIIAGPRASPHITMSSCQVRVTPCRGSRWELASRGRGAADLPQVPTQLVRTENTTAGSVGDSAAPIQQRRVPPEAGQHVRRESVPRLSRAVPPTPIHNTAPTAVRKRVLSRPSSPVLPVDRPVRPRRTWYPARSRQPPPGTDPDIVVMLSIHPAPVWNLP